MFWKYSAALLGYKPLRMEAEFSSEALELSYQISWIHSKIMSADACFLWYDTVSIGKKFKKSGLHRPWRSRQQILTKRR